MEKKKLEVIPDWKRAWKFASVQFTAAGILVLTMTELFGSVWTQLPPEIQAYLPDSTVVAGCLFGLSMIGRVLKFAGSIEPDDIDYEQL